VSEFEQGNVQAEVEVVVLAFVLRLSQSRETEGFVPAAVRIGGVWFSCARDGRRGCEWTLSRSSTKIEEHHHANS
jgi:hypothetical protein